MTQNRFKGVTVMPVQPTFKQRWLSSTLPILSFVIAVAFANVWASTAAHGEVNQPSSIVAVVNADPITRATLTDATIERYGAEVLDNMINRHLILQECTKRGISVTKEEVSAEIQRLASKFGLSLDSYLQLLQEERNISPNQYSREVIWPMLALRRLVADKVEVTNEEFNRAFMAQYGEAVKCRLIMVGQRAISEDIHRQVTADPKKFAHLAKEKSEDETSASVGGLIPPIRHYSGDSRLEEAAFALQNQEISPILPLGDQWILLQAVRRIPAHNPAPQAIPVIKQQINDRIRDEKMRVAAGELFERLQKESRVVKVLGDDALMQQHPGTAAIINGEQITLATVGEECVKRHGQEVLEGEINRKLLSQALRQAGQTITKTDLQAEIENAAVSYGFVRNDGEADLEAWMTSVTEDGKVSEEIYMTDNVWPSVALRKLVAHEVELTEKDIQHGFEAAYGPRAEVLAIVLSDQRTAQKVWEMARDNPTEQFFGDLAEQYSVEPVSSSNRGKVPPIRKHSGQPAIEREAFSLKPGERSGIVATGGKYIILWCQGFTEPIVSDPAVVREELIRDLRETKTNRAMLAKFEQLNDQSEIENFLASAEEKNRVATRPTIERN